MATIAPDVYRSMGLRTSEYERIVSLMGREPSLTELGMFAVMWSEHCGYKYTRPILKYFSEYKKAIEGSGLENAGIVEIEPGWGIALKIESHNHPSAVEPYQGAATGVGGIIRDIFAMGARPVACLNSLRFGPIRDGEADPKTVARNRYLFERVVAGIGGYGNCVGVPTVGGEVAFHPRFTGNPLVNAMCVGLVRTDEVATAEAKGVGNPVLYLGSATGRDGIHGATFASDALDEDSHKDIPNVQIGDPFAEKALIEATLEALQTGAVIAIQDMGAAGITCSTVEMAAKGGVGMEIDLDKVPAREQGMTAEDLMLSESQERMLAVVHKGREEEILSIFRKWEQKAAVIGEVTEGGRLVVSRYGKVEVDVDPQHFTDQCPTYTTEPQVPEYHLKAHEFDATALLEVADLNAALLKLLAHPDIASKRWVYRQYDHQVQTQTVLLPGQGDAAVLALRGLSKGVSVAVDGNGRWTYFDPYVGGQLAVFEAARNLACTGARAIGTTDGLNFGNPERPHVYWQLERAVKGIADACEALGAPVVSGNASLYNESELGEILPTPMIGMVGEMSSPELRLGINVPPAGCELILLYYEPRMNPGQGLGASLALQELHRIGDGLPVAPDPTAEVALCRLLCDLAEKRLLLAAHDASDGGLAVTIVEMLIENELGADIDLTELGDLRSDALLFGEVPGRAIVACLPELSNDVASRAKGQIAAVRLGRVDPENRSLRITRGGISLIELQANDLKRAHALSLPGLMES